VSDGSVPVKTFHCSNAPHIMPLRIVLCAPACMLIAYLAAAQPVSAGSPRKTSVPEDGTLQSIEWFKEVFRVDGLNLAAGEQSASGFSIPTSLGGTSIRVMADRRTFDAIVLSTAVFQFPDGFRPSVRAVLPSKTPPGDALLILTNDGRESSPFKIRVVKRDFGLYDFDIRQGLAN
jgi:hypothetical protein